jgi:serine phosphatase RsbU (regulator of sigma subunit)
MKAAVPVMMFSGILDAQMEMGDRLEDLFVKLNRSLYRNLDRRTFICFTMAELNPATRMFRMSNCGCPYPYHYKSATQEVVELQVDAYPLGIRPNATYQAIETQLEPSDRVVFCSDGIVEAGNTAGEIFGFDRTAETIRTGCQEGLSSEALLERIIAAVKTFAGDEPQGDDQTIVVLHVEANLRLLGE